MENQENSSVSLFDLNLDENAKQSLKSVANTAAIAAILSLVGSILSVVVYFIEKSRAKPFNIEGFEKFQSSSDTSGNLSSVVIGFIIAVLLFYFLNRFASTTKSAINENDQQKLAVGLGSLASYFKTIGILLIIVISIVVIAFLAIGIGRS